MICAFARVSPRPRFARQSVSPRVVPLRHEGRGGVWLGQRRRRATLLVRDTQRPTDGVSARKQALNVTPSVIPSGVVRVRSWKKIVQKSTFATTDRPNGRPEIPVAALPAMQVALPLGWWVGRRFSEVHLVAAVVLGPGRPVCRRGVQL